MEQVGGGELLQVEPQLLEIGARVGAGHEVQTAADGQEVIEVVTAGDPGGVPEVLLLDAMMPRKSGLDALRELRDAGFQMPALIVSAHQNSTDADAPTDLGIAGYVTKPIDFDLLLGEIDALTRVA